MPQTSMMSDIEEKKKKEQQKIREKESEKEPEKMMKYISVTLRRKKEKIEPAPRTKRAESYKHFDRVYR